MSIFEAIIQAIIQGLTEFLPVSSSGHLSLLQHFFNIDGSSGAFFTIILHVGTLVAVFIAFRKLIWSLIKEFFAMIKAIFTGKFSFKNMNPERNMIFMLIIACLPLLVVYVFKDQVAAISSDNDIIVEGICFLVTACLLLLSDRLVRGTKKIGDINVRNALTVGVTQGVATLPGISRSGSTITGGLLCGFTRETAIQFSFILGIPAILGGAVTEISDVHLDALDIGIVHIVIGLALSAIVGFLSIKMVNWLLKSNKFKYFGYYTGILGIFVILIGILEISGVL